MTDLAGYAAAPVIVAVVPSSGCHVDLFACCLALIRYLDPPVRDQGPEPTMGPAAQGGDRDPLPSADRRRRTPTLTFPRRLAEHGTPFWVRFVLVPGRSADPDNVAGVARFAADLGNVERVDVLPFPRRLGAAEHRSPG